MNEITYSPGRLAKKIGVSRDTLMRHLRNTGLIYQCFQTDNRYWRIPYNVAAEIASPEALSLRQKEAPRHRPKEESDAPGRERGTGAFKSRLKADQAEAEIFSNAKTTTKRPKSRVEILTQPRDDNNLAEHYGQIGKVLRQAGITLADLVRDYYENKQQQKDDTTPEGQTTGELSRDDDQS